MTLHPESAPNHVVVCHLGRVAYEPAWALQKQIQAGLIAAKRSDPPSVIPHVMLLVEHPPVITFGKKGGRENLLVREDFLQDKGFSLYDIERGNLGANAVVGGGLPGIVGSALAWHKGSFVPAAAALTDIQGVVADLQVMTRGLAAGEGTMGALLADDRLYERMTIATTELAGLMATMNRSDGTIGRMIRDPALYERMNATLGRLDSIGAAILGGEGSLGRLLNEDDLYEGLVGVVERADSAVGGVQGLVAGVGAGEGTIARLIEDPALYDQFLKTIVDLQGLIAELRANPKPFLPPVTVEVF